MVTSLKSPFHSLFHFYLISNVHAYTWIKIKNKHVLTFVAPVSTTYFSNGNFEKKLLNK